MFSGSTSMLPFVTFHFIFCHVFQNLRDSAFSTFITNSMCVPYSSSCASLSVFPSNCGDPSTRQQRVLKDTSSVALPFIFQNSLQYSGVYFPSEQEPDFSAEHVVLQSQNRRNLDAQTDVKSTSPLFAAEITNNPECNLDSGPVRCRSLGKEVLTPPNIASLASLVMSTSAAVPLTSVDPLANPAAAATPISTASPRSSVVPSQSPVPPLLHTNTGTFLTTANEATGTGSSPLTTANQKSRTGLLLFATANQETRTGSSLSTTANQERGTGPPLLTTTNQETGSMSTKTNCKPAKSELYKTELCRAFIENGSCGYGEKCQFAHGERDQRAVLRHAKYKTKQCWTYHSTGFCYYGARCNFIHDEDRLGRSWMQTPPGQGVNSDRAWFGARLDTTSGVSSDLGLGLNFKAASEVNSIPGFGVNLELAVDWDSRLEVNSDHVRLGLKPRVERALSAGVGPNLDSRIAALNLKPGISRNSQSKAGRNAKPNTLRISNGTVPISKGTVPISYGMVPISYGTTVPISTGTVPISYGTVPISTGTVPISYGTTVPISNGTLPVSYGVLPVSNGVVRSSPPITTISMDAGVVPSLGQDPRQRNQLSTLGWTLENQGFGHSSVITDANPPECCSARDKDVSLKQEFSGITLAHGQSDLSPPQLPSVQTLITSELRPDSWNKERDLLGVSSLNQGCGAESSSSTASTYNVWSSLIQHPRCWTLS